MRTYLAGSIVLLLSSVAHARGGAPVTTVWFGSPAGTQLASVRPEPLGVTVGRIGDEPDGSDPTGTTVEAAAETRPASAVEASTHGGELQQTVSDASATPTRPATREGATPPLRVAVRRERRPRSVRVVRRMGGRQLEVFEGPLVSPEGEPREEARRALTTLMRPRSEREPPVGDEEAAHRADPGLLIRLQAIGEAFPGHAIEILSGYRPGARSGSRHRHARALDLNVEGVARTDVRDFAVTLSETGVGWYPNSVFVHIDVRTESAYWIDLSGPGEAPRYVANAQPPAAPDSPSVAALQDETDGWLRRVTVPAP